MITRVLAIGQRWAGDDAVALEVAARLRTRRVPDLEIHELDEPSSAVELLSSGGRVVIVDAALGPSPGRVHRLRPDALAGARAGTVSAHAPSLAEAIGATRELHGPAVLAHVHVVGVEIGSVARGVRGLSPEVARAVDAAVDAVVDLASRRRR